MEKRKIFSQISWQGTKKKNIPEKNLQNNLNKEENILQNQQLEWQLLRQVPIGHGDIFWDNHKTGQEASTKSFKQIYITKITNLT